MADSDVVGREYGTYLSYASGPVSVGVAYDDLHVGTSANLIGGGARRVPSR
ncbi:hypothetical protein [Cupriavidus sp. CP313]